MHYLWTSFLTYFKVHSIILLTRDDMHNWNFLHIEQQISISLPQFLIIIILCSSDFPYFEYSCEGNLIGFAHHWLAKRQRAKETEREREKPGEGPGFLFCLHTKLSPGKYSFQMVETRENVLIGHKAKIVGYRMKRRKQPHSFFLWLRFGSLVGAFISKADVPWGWGLCGALQYTSLHWCSLQDGKWPSSV